MMVSEKDQNAKFILSEMVTYLLDILKIGMNIILGKIPTFELVVLGVGYGKRGTVYSCLSHKH